MTLHTANDSNHIVAGGLHRPTPPALKLSSTYHHYSLFHHTREGGHVRVNVLHNVSWHGGELSLEVVYITIQRVILLYQIVAVVHRVADDVGAEVSSDASMALAVSIDTPVSLLQKLWHGLATLILRGHIVLRVCPEPLDGLDARQVWWSVDQLMTVCLH